LNWWHADSNTYRAYSPTMIVLCMHSFYPSSISLLSLFIHSYRVRKYHFCEKRNKILYKTKLDNKLISLEVKFWWWLLLTSFSKVPVNQHCDHDLIWLIGVSGGRQSLYTSRSWGLKPLTQLHKSKHVWKIDEGRKIHDLNLQPSD